MRTTGMVRKIYRTIDSIQSYFSSECSRNSKEFLRMPPKTDDPSDSKKDLLQWINRFGKSAKLGLACMLDLAS
jgi:hypothetical protein